MKTTSIFSRIGGFIKAHKIISSIIILAVIGGGYWLYRAKTTTATQTRYVLGTARVGTVSSVVTGTGQVSASDSLDIKPKVSGDITAVLVKNGDEVSAGQLIAQIDSRDAEKTLRDAQINLQSAQISLDKSLQPMSTSTAYDNAFNAINSAFLDLPAVSSDLNDMLYNWRHSPYLADDQAVNQAAGQTGLDLKQAAGLKYDAAKKIFESVLVEYRTTTRASDQKTIDTLLAHTLDAVRAMADAVKNTRTAVSYINDSLNSSTKPAEIATDQNTLDSYTTKLNSHVSDVLSAQTAIQSDQTSEVNNSLDIKSQQLSVEQKKNAVADAQDTLSDYYIRAPFSGIIASVPVNVGDAASSATVIATVITKNQIATIPLNEVDAAKVKVGQKATLTFDAISGLAIDGTVSEVDTLGTVSQGVVSYNVQISFGSQDPRVKPSMSVTASITTDSRENVLSVPTSAIKTNRAGSYVEVVDSVSTSSASSTFSGITLSVPPRQQPVEVGLVGDTRVEIISGLNEGDHIVTRTITTSTTATANTGSFLTGGNRTGGQAARALGR